MTTPTATEMPMMAGMESAGASDVGGEEEEAAAAADETAVAEGV
jgi:hypothetical protein